MLDGTVFRTPIMVKGIDPCVSQLEAAPSPSPATPTATCTRTPRSACPAPARRSWSSPVTTARRSAQLVHDFDGAGVAPGHAQPGRLHRQLRPCAASSSRWTPSRTCGSPPRTPSPRSTTTASRTSSRRSTTTEYDARFEEAGHRVLLHAHRRRRGPGHAGRGRLHLGLQELRRRRDERHGVHRLRVAGHDDLGAGEPRRASTSTRRLTARCSVTTTSI